ncbi:hypothetical protein L2E82_40737 [Cichorium intybus]|uniref:Uncharacterized protein n=1 Tax=Cichorium intybus TaxID=13427 RepID=A0ACB9AMH3_CICIN|nr:hypothetical protein L2E82_40737 [Cichorium intybus]
MKPDRVRKHKELRVHRLYRLIDKKIKREMELKNLKLYMENLNILKENEKLRKKATQLRQENLFLLSELEKKNPSFRFVTMKETRNFNLL